VADIPGLIEGRTVLGGLDWQAFNGPADDPHGRLRGRPVSGHADCEPGWQYGRDNRQPQIVAINKIDMPEVAGASGTTEELQKRGTEPWFISAASGEGVAELMAAAGTRLKEMRAEEPVVETEPPLPVLRPREKGVRVVRENGAFRVEGERTIAFAEMMPTDLEEGRAELWRRFTRWA
jgi:hypothetical protein